jgi:hypothetical protein
MHWPQIAVIVMLAMRCATSILLHNYPAPMHWWHGVGNSILLAWLLWCGGFFG